MRLLSEFPIKVPGVENQKFIMLAQGDGVSGPLRFFFVVTTKSHRTFCDILAKVIGLFV